LAASVVAEIVERIRADEWVVRRTGRGLWPSRALATLLIGWIVATFVSTPASAATPPRSTATELVPRAATNMRVVAAPGRVHVVVARDTLWDIAASKLGNALRWREILEMNRGRVQADGGRITDDALLHVGWTLVLPDSAPPRTGTVQVRPGDTLTELAGRYLDDPARYDELYTANDGVPQPNGGSLQDPDLIRPGWLLRLPPGVDASGTHPAPTADARPDGSPPATRPTPSPTDPAPTDASQPGRESTVPAPTAAVPPPSTATKPSTSRDQGTTSSRSPSSPAATTTPSTPTPTSAAVPATVPPSSVVPMSHPVHGAVTAPSPAIGSALGIAGLLAAALLTCLLVLRRRQQRWRRHGRRIALPQAELANVETALVRTAQPAGPLFLDLVLRSVSAVAPVPYPELETVRLCAAGVALTLAAPQPPPMPYQDARTDGSVWHVPHDARLPLTEATAVGVANPYPAVASVGRNDQGVTVLLDLEQAGAVHLRGDPSRAVDLLRHVAVELGTSRWADAVTVLTVGLEPDLADLPSRRLEQPADLHEAVTRLRAAMRTAVDDRDRAGDGSLLERRVRDQLSESWLVTVLLVAHGPELDAAGLDGLCAQLAAGGRSTVAVVTAGFPDGFDGTVIDVDPAGFAAAPDRDDERLQVERMPARLARDVVAIIGTATAPDQPVNKAEASAPWADDMNEDGAWQPPSAPDTDDTSDPAVEPLPERNEFPPAEPVDPMAQRRLLLVEQQDPHLDDDLTLWTSTTTPARPLIAILGPPQLRSPGQLPDKRHSWYLEVVVYLALHPLGVDRDKLMTDLWPEGVAIQPPTIRRAVAEARAWAGKDVTADPPTDFIPGISPAGGDRYRITGHLTDWDLFRRLRKRAQARVAAGQSAAAIADYTAALRLIRGPVLHPLRARGYAWLHDPDQRHGDLIPGFVIDTAHELVDLALASGDLDLARFAATTAQTVDPDRTSDRPFTDLMRIAHAAGDLEEMRTHAELLLAERDFEVGEELPPESFAVFDKLFPHGLRARAS
jgi:hypothetical protein